MQLRILRPVFASLAFVSISLGQSPSEHARSNHDYALLNSHIITKIGVVHKNNRYFFGPNKGQKAPDTCEISFKLKPNQRAIEARGIGPTQVNADGTCQIEMEVGQPPANVLPAYNAVPPNSQLKPHSATAAPSPGTSSGYAQGWITDPPGFWTTSEQINVSWNWSGVPQTCASLYSYSEGVPSSAPYWYKVSQSIYPITDCFTDPTTGLFYTEAGAGAYVNWENDVFPACLGVPANAYYWPIYASGDNFGDLVGDFAWELYGPSSCIYLLTPNFQLYRTYN